MQALAENELADRVFCDSFPVFNNMSNATMNQW